jgi:hypothetical protein
MIAYFAAQREEDLKNPSPKIKDMDNPPLYAQIEDCVQVNTVNFLATNPEGTLEDFAAYVRDYAEEKTDRDMFAAYVTTDAGDEI